MSKTKKEMRATKKAVREANQGKKVIQWIAGCLAVLFLIMFFGYLIMFS
ncbi:MAG: hypothetical protein J6W75_03235 [Bacteroidaceae bacterium]|nr:hypothetical protein [Bacteroidaceae bacterium]